MPWYWLFKIRYLTFLAIFLAPSQKVFALGFATNLIHKGREGSLNQMAIAMAGKINSFPGSLSPGRTQMRLDKPSSLYIERWSAHMDIQTQTNFYFGPSTADKIIIWFQVCSFKIHALWFLRVPDTKPVLEHKGFFGVFVYLSPLFFRISSICS